MNPKLISAPAVEPISKDELKLQAKISSGTAEDSLLDLYIAAARERAEAITGLALINSTWLQTLDEFPCNEIKLLKPPVRAIVSLTYVDEAGVTQTLDSSRYALDADNLPGWLLPARDTYWPDTADVINAVQITFTAGYGPAGSDVPANARAWIAATAAFLYANREALDAGGRIQALPNRFIDALLDPLIVYGI